MAVTFPRRHLLVGGVGFLALGGMTQRVGAQEAATTPAVQDVHAGFPRQEEDAVREVVGASHFNMERVRELVTARPALAKAAWDWGFGDWETALGAASHTGQVEIARFLMSHGARADLFTLAMLGEVAVVRAAVGASPGIQRVHGPHGITLLQHVRNRLTARDVGEGETARLEQLAEFLVSVGGADEPEPDRELSPEEKAVYVGSFGLGSGGDLEVAISSRGILTLARGGQAGARNLRCVGDHAFAPAGAPGVRVVFDVTEGRAIRLTVHDPMPVAKAERR